MSHYIVVGKIDNNNIMNPYNNPTDFNNNDTDEIERIDISDIFWNSLMNNKILLFAMVPLFIGYYLQDVVFTKSIAQLTTHLTEFVDDISIMKVFIFILPYIVALILFYVSNVITSQSTSRIELDTIYELINKIIESISTSKKQINVNDLIIHIKKIGDTKSIYTVLVTYIIPTIIIGIGLLYNFIQIDGKYSLLVILIFIVLMMVTAKLEFDSIDHAYNMENSTNVIYDEIHEIISNIDSVITSNTQEESMEYVKNANDKTYELASINNLHNNNTTYGLQVISIVAILGINYLAYRMYYMKQIDATMLTSTVLLSLLFMDYYNYSVQGVKNLINSIGRYNETRSYFKEFTIIKQSNVKKSKQNILKVNEGNISINNLTINYGNNIILNNVTIQIKGHSVTGLVGSIGSGKTTILKALIGIISYNGDIHMSQ
jgi:ABC-type multidrug transport system fused ATPase/permease subunit